MRRSREVEVRPIIKGTVENFGAVHNRFAFENTGKGAAHNVTARWGFRDLDYVREWQIPLIPSGQSHHFYLPFEGDRGITTQNGIQKELVDAEAVLWFEVECTDGFGEPVTHREEINVLDTIESRAGEMMIEDELHKIQKEIVKLTKEVKKLN